MHELYILIQKGKWINWIILSLSLISLMIVLERAYFFFRSRFDLQKVLAWVEKGRDEKKGFRFLKPFPYPQSLFNSFIAVFCKPQNPILDNSLEEQGEIEIQKMEKGLWILKEIGHIAPLLGLLGTILGLIDAFAVFSKAGDTAEVSMLADGIWAAMITTASGLIVAIPTFIFYKVYEHIIDKRVIAMNYFVSKISKLVKKEEKLLDYPVGFPHRSHEENYGDPLNENV